MAQKLTRCPSCQTIYWITPSQLSVREGLVRCGHCEHVFDALETLVQTTPQNSNSTPNDLNENISTADLATNELPQETETSLFEKKEASFEDNTKSSISQALFADNNQEPFLTQDKLSQTELVDSHEPALKNNATIPNSQKEKESEQLNTNLINKAFNAHSTDDNTLSEKTTQKHFEAKTEILNDSPPEENSVTVATPTPYTKKETTNNNAPPEEATSVSAPAEKLSKGTQSTLSSSSNKIMSWLRKEWRYPLLILLVLTSLAQIIGGGRNAIANAFPSLYPILSKMTKPFGLITIPPQKLEVLSIEASDLRQDPNNPKRFMFSAIIRNKENIPVAFPLIVLSLLDGRDATIVRKVIRPKEYLTLEKQSDEEQVFPPNSEQDVSIVLERSDIYAIGFRVHLSYTK